MFVHKSLYFNLTRVQGRIDDVSMLDSSQVFTTQVFNSFQQFCNFNQGLIYF